MFNGRRFVCSRWCEQFFYFVEIALLFQLLLPSLYDNFKNLLDKCEGVLFNTKDDGEDLLPILTFTLPSPSEDIFFLSQSKPCAGVIFSFLVFTFIFA
jgi:hypothetical protein